MPVTHPRSEAMSENVHVCCTGPKEDGSCDRIHCGECIRLCPTGKYSSRAASRRVSNAAATTTNVPPDRLEMALTDVLQSDEASAPTADQGSPSSPIELSALTDCPDCGHRVSRRASACPSCGAPIAASGGASVEAEERRRAEIQRSGMTNKERQPVQAQRGHDQAGIQPQAREEMRRFRKAMWGAGIGFAAIIVIKIILDTQAPEHDRQTPSVPTPAVQAGTPQNDAPRRADPHRGPQVGESFKLGDFVYVITGATRTSSVGNELVRRQAPPGSSFVLVSFQITNDANETKTVMTDDFRLKDSRGRMFRPSSDATTALVMSGDEHDFLLSELQPGIPRRSTTPFLIPDDAFSPGLRIVIPEKGLWATRTVEVTLLPR